MVNDSNDSLIVDKMQTSRNTVLDMFELITNQIALVSHLSELWVEKSSLFADTGDKKIEIEANNILYLMERATNIRRNLMSQLEKEHDTDHFFWCSIKHAIASYGYATELLMANPDKLEYQKLLQQTSSQMIQIASLYLKMEMITCARCFNDQL